MKKFLFAVVMGSSLFFSNASEAASTSQSCLPSVLTSTLNQVRSMFGALDILSTHRPGARIAGSGKPSYHASCRAVDFKPRQNYREVVNWLYANHSGGLGTYSCGMSHIHIDNGPKVRFHKCVGGSDGSTKKKYKKKKKVT